MCSIYNGPPCTFSSYCICLVFHTSVQVTFCGGLCIIVVLSAIHLALYLFTVVFLLFHFWLTPEEEPSSKRCVFLYISPCTVYEPTTCHSYDPYTLIHWSSFDKQKFWGFSLSARKGNPTHGRTEILALAPRISHALCLLNLYSIQLQTCFSMSIYDVNIYLSIMMINVWLLQKFR